MNQKSIKAEPILETSTLQQFRAELIREFGNRKKVRGSDSNPNWWTKKPEDVALVELGRWFKQMIEEGNGVRRQKKDVDKYLKEIEREQAMRGRFYPTWVKQNRFSEKQSVKWIAIIHDIKIFLKEYNCYHFNLQTELFQ